MRPLQASYVGQAMMPAALAFLAPKVLLDLGDRLQRPFGFIGLASAVASETVGGRALRRRLLQRPGALSCQCALSRRASSIGSSRVGKAYSRSAGRCFSQRRLELVRARCSAPSRRHVTATPNMPSVGVPCSSGAAPQACARAVSPCVEHALALGRLVLRRCVVSTPGLAFCPRLPGQHLWCRDCGSLSRTGELDAGGVFGGGRFGLHDTRHSPLAPASQP
jgi:hypothetical protein